MARRKSQISLLAEILEWILLPLLLLWLMNVGLTLLAAQGIANPPHDRELGRAVRGLAQQLVLATASGSAAPALSLPTAAASSEATDSQTWQVIGPNGEHLGGSLALSLPQAAERPTADELRFRDDIIGPTPVRVAYMWVRLPGQPEAAPATLVQVAATLESRSLLAEEILRGVVLPQLVFLPLGVMLVWMALARSISPLNELQQRIRRRDTNDLSPISETGVPEEVSSLVQAINDLLMRLDQSIATQKHFLADAAHQLKTPLAGLRMQAELAQREIDAGHGDEQTISRSLRNIALSSQRAAHMVNQLLAMARTDKKDQSLAMAPVDLAELATELMPDFVPRALEKRIDFGYEGDSPGRIALIQGHRLLLGELLRNLVDNALLCTPAGGTLTVRVQERSDQVVMQVEDSGPGIPAAERENVFRPFYRVLGTPTDGSGLGLAIVREIALRHDAEVHLEDANLRHPDGLNDQAGAPFGPGVRFTLRFAALAPEFDG